MGDIKSRKLLYAKGYLFLFGGVLASALLLFEHPTLKDALLLFVAVWCFARFYYFAFYVIEHYIDREYKFSGLLDFALYVLRQATRRDSSTSDD
jgi:hypothetical protein